MSQHDASSGDPHRLSGLAQAAFVLKCLPKAKALKQLLRKASWRRAKSDDQESRASRKAVTALCSIAATKMKRRQIVTSIAGMFLSYELTIQCVVLFPRKVFCSQ